MRSRIFDRRDGRRRSGDVPRGGGGSEPGGARTRTRRLRQAIATIATGGLLAAGAVVVPAATAAAPVYEIDARWTSEATQVRDGGLLEAEWRVNVNDSGAAPVNDDVEDVTFVATAGNGVFAEIPEACLTDGVTPPSSLSSDGTVLTCNLGTVRMGTAVVVQTGLLADGEAGDEVSLVGEIGGQRAELTPVPIRGDFGMDIAWEGPSNWTRAVDSGVEVDFLWTLNLLSGSPAGPDSVSYTLNLGVNTPVPVRGLSCEPFALPGASSHPWSGGDHPDEQRAPFVGSCVLAPTGTPGVFTLTLSGIDYSLTQVPERDSAGNRLPTDRHAVASGRVVFGVDTRNAFSVSLDSSSPDYTSPTGETFTDDVANNTVSKTWTPLGDFAGAFMREHTGAGGTNWDDAYRVAPGTEVRSQNDLRRHRAIEDPERVLMQCTAIDTKYADFTRVVLPESTNRSLVTSDVLTMRYYVGDDPRLDPASAGYDPNAFVSDCEADAANWVEGIPADPSQVKAVRAAYDVESAGGAHASIIQVFSRIKDDVPAGTDVWTFHSYRSGEGAGGWVTLGDRSENDTGNRTPTPDARYPRTTGSRDILRIVSVAPFVEKTVDHSVARPGETVTYTVMYSANGGSAAPEQVDGYVLRDTLPAGTSYVPGSASLGDPEVSEDDEGRQVLTWTVDGVVTNTTHPLTYQVLIGSDAAVDQPLVNSVTGSAAGLTSRRAEAEVAFATSGYTSIGKSAVTALIPNPDGTGVGTGEWVVTLRSRDPLPQAFTDTIDILPFNGDGRGTAYSGSFTLAEVSAVEGATVYYTDVDPALLSDDPADASNGGPGDPAGNTVGWTTSRPADPTAIRVLGPALAAGATQQFRVSVQTEGLRGGDLLVNRAQARAEHTELVMRTSARIMMAPYYSAQLKKYIRGNDGVWYDANTAEEYPAFRDGDGIRFRIEVTNTGQGTLTDVEVSDDKQPELGAFAIPTLAPGETVSHEYEVEATPADGDSVVNTACAVAAIPADTGIAPTINCDPAGFVKVGSPTHEKTLVSAEPIGDGTWRIVYALDVVNVSAVATTYSLEDRLRFTEQADVVSAEVTSMPEGVAPHDPAWDGVSQPRIATDVALPAADGDGAGRHRYLVTVVAEVPLHLDAAETECATVDRAFMNTSTLTGPGGLVEHDDACASPPSIDLDKTVSSGPVANGDGTWTVDYDLVVTNDGAGDGVYDLADRLEFADTVRIHSAVVADAPEGVTPLEGWTGTGAEGAEENRIVVGEALPAGTSHLYRVRVVLSLADDVAPEDLICPAPGERGGLANSARVTHNGQGQDADACASPPLLDIVKSLSGAPQPVAGEPGAADISYEITVTNRGAGDGVYTLEDALAPGLGVNVIGIPSLTSDVAQSVGLNPGYDGVGDVRVVTDQPIAGSSGEPVVHTYLVTVRVSVPQDASEATGECVAEDGTAPGALDNVASIVFNGIVRSDSECVLPSPPTFDKTLVSAEAIGDGLWRVEYDLTVGSAGPSEAVYDLDDELRFAGEITVRSAEVDGPEGVEIETAWDGQEHTRVTTGARIAGILDAGYAPHVYRVTVIAAVPLRFGERDAEGNGAPGCTMDKGKNMLWQGLNNVATLGSDGVTLTDTDCAPVPEIEVVKSVVGVPLVEDRRVTTTYEIAVSNVGGAAGVYELYDQLRYEEGINVVEVSVANAAPGDVPVRSGFTGLGETSRAAENAITEAVPLGVGQSHTYRVVVRGVIGADVRFSDGQCSDKGGVNNLAVVTHNGLEGSAVVCPVVVSPPPLAMTGGGLLTGGLWGAGALLLAGTGLLFAARRRTSVRSAVGG